MNKGFKTCGAILLVVFFSAAADQLEWNILDGEYWWAGLSSRGYQTPYDATSKVTYDLWGDNKGNQAQPLLLSSKGRYIWSEQPIKYVFNQGTLTVSTREGKIDAGKEGANLRDAFEYVSKTYFPSDGNIPDELLFTHPQYNTWIELMYDQNEEDILAYAQAIIDQGYPPGVLMIDDNWQEDYGTWEFSPRRFQDPKGMIDKLHAMGFKVMMWMCPFVSADSADFRQLAQEGLLILDPQKTQNILWANTKNKAAVIRWWNGASACLDLSNPKAQAWFKEELDYLVEEYGVDGFKFDAGDARFYTEGVVSWQQDITPNDHTQFFAEFGLNYPLNEYRASWKMAGLPLAQRLRDKGHRWEDLAKLIPDQMSQSVMGYAYTCPDMIGGGEYRSFLNGAVIDEELIVRSAQIHALMPMMQFRWHLGAFFPKKISRYAYRWHTCIFRWATTSCSLRGKHLKPVSLSLNRWRLRFQTMDMKPLMISSSLEITSSWRRLWKKECGLARSYYRKGTGPRMMGRYTPAGKQFRYAFR